MDNYPVEVYTLDFLEELDPNVTAANIASKITVGGAATGITNISLDNLTGEFTFELNGLTVGAHADVTLDYTGNATVVDYAGNDRVFTKTDIY